MRAALLILLATAQLAHAQNQRKPSKPTPKSTPRELTKDQVRPALKQLVPKLTRCYAAAKRKTPAIAGVVNLQLAIASTSQRTQITVRGFDTSGELGASQQFRDCATKTAQAAVLTSSGEGSIELSYPITFAPQPPDNRDTALFEEAKQAVAAKQWRTALDKAERALESTSIDGTIRRPLIEIAGVAACHLNLDVKVRHYTALADATAEQTIRDTCTRVAAAGQP